MKKQIITTNEAPARVTIADKELPLGAKVEIECNASGNI